MREAATAHDRIITPGTDPGRFTRQEAAAFRRGVCGQTGYGSAGGDICGRPSKRGASFGNCDEHNADMLVDYRPDGTRRYDIDPGYDKHPDYRRRVAEALAAHRRHCKDRSCECRTGSGRRKRG